ncbi:MAG TPA: hypothetical protein VFC87_02735 [Perlabentimonas sp.]|nr:hypothetical protein [Tenuifilaceae bacterium]HZJ73699.1 hypothetical protein [Perlabentimonas sp.]
MKTAKIIISMLLFLSINTYAQDVYNVTRVNGNVTILGSGENVVAGDVLNPDEFLLFENLESYLITIGSDLNRHQIKIQESQLSADTQMLTSTVEQAAKPTRMRSLMLAHFNPAEQEISDLRQYFGNDKFSVIGDAVNVPLNDKKYPLTDDKFIVFYYRVDNSPVSKKIGHNEQTLLVEKDQLFTSSVGSISGNEISNLAVYEYENTTKQGNEITRFTLVFVDKDELVKEFNTIIPILKRQKMEDNEIKKYLIEYYYDFYGATDSKTIDSFAEQIVKGYQ